MFAHNLSAVVDAVKESFQLPRVVKRSETPRAVKESVSEVTCVLVPAHDLATVVDAPGFRARRPGVVERTECSSAVEEPVGPACVPILAYDLAVVVDAERKRNVVDAPG